MAIDDDPEIKSVEDMLGVDVQRGDTIAYAVRVGNNPYLEIGEVLGFYKFTDIHYWGDLIKMRIKNPNNHKPSILETRHKRFIKIEKRA